MIFKISLLIICKNVSKLQDVRSEVMALDDENIEWEILVGEGDNPSEQRNVLAQKARGDWLLFLDDDSRPAQNLLEVYKNLVENKTVLIAGGPSLLERAPGAIAKLSQVFFSSIWGIGPYLSRYNSSGETRLASERELILCNMLVQKEFFLRQGGFCQNLYPNEENEFIKRVRSERHIFYTPDAVVVRPARSTLAAFSKQLFTYGKGRLKNIYLKKNFGDFIFMAPAFFSAYLLLCPFIIYSNQWALLIPLMIYFALSLYAGLSRKSELGLVVLLSPLFFMAGHFSYGFGLWSGCLEYAILKKSLKLSSANFINIYQVK